MYDFTESEDHLISLVMDFSGMKIKLDHSVGSPEAVTNWRQSVGFPVFGTGQVILASDWSRQIT